MSGAEGAVLGMDLGSEWLKTSIVGHGTQPIQMVTNEMSRRKSPPLAGFYRGELVCGEEASSMSVRFPERIYGRLRDMLGLRWDDARVVDGILGSNLEPEVPVGTETVHKTAKGRGAVAFEVSAEDDPSGKPQVYGAEELMAMVLDYGRRTGDAFVRADEPRAAAIKEVAIAVPAFLGQRERAALADAAELAGLRVLTFVSEHAAAAVQYGIDREFEAGKSQRVMLYDAGANSVVVALVEFGTYKDIKKGVGKDKLVRQASVLAVEWEGERTGGAELDRCLAEYLADEFNILHPEAYGQGGDVRSDPRAMAKLVKAAKKAKEVLSANKAAAVGVEGMITPQGGEIDFRPPPVPREAFELVCADSFAGFVAPLERLLADPAVGVTPADLDAFELIGGSSRVPAVQERLQAVLGKGRELDRHMDGDESIALGTGFVAANYSTSYRLRPFGLADASPFGFQLLPHADGVTAAKAPAWPVEAAKAGDARDLNEDEDIEVGQGGKKTAAAKPLKLISRGMLLPARRTATLKNRSKDFSVSVGYDLSADTGGRLPLGYAEGDAEVARYDIVGVPAVVADKGKNVDGQRRSFTGRVSLTFSMDASGLLQLSSADALVDAEETYFAFEPLPESEGAVEDDAAAGKAVPTEFDDASVGEPEPKDGESGAAGGGEGEDTAKVAGDAKDSKDPKDKEKTKPKKPEQKRVEKVRSRVIKVPLQVVSAPVPAQAKKFAGPLGKDHLEAIRTRFAEIKRLEDERKALAGLKNDLEAYVFEIRGKLLDLEDADPDGWDDGLLQGIATLEQVEAARSVLAAAEDWLYDAPESEVTLDAVETKLDEARGMGGKILFRLAEVEARPAAVSKARSFIDDARVMLEEWTQERTWLPEDDVEAAKQGVDNLATFLEDSEKKQAATAAHEDPAFTSKEVRAKVRVLGERITRLGQVKKPVVKEDKTNKTSEANVTEGVTEDPKVDPQADETEEGLDVDAEADPGTGRSAEEDAMPESPDPRTEL